MREYEIDKALRRLPVNTTQMIGGAVRVTKVPMSLKKSFNGSFQYHIEGHDKPLTKKLAVTRIKQILGDADVR